MSPERDPATHESSPDDNDSQLSSASFSSEESQAAAEQSTESETSPSADLPEPLLVELHFHLAAELVEHKEALLGGIIRFVGHGAPMYFREFCAEREDIAPAFEPLGHDLQRVIGGLADSIDDLSIGLQAQDRAAVSQKLMSEVQPALRSIAVLLEQSRNLYQRYGEELYDSGKDPCASGNAPNYFARLQTTFEDTSHLLSRFLLDTAAEPTALDLNSFVVQGTPQTQLGQVVLHIQRKARPTFFDHRELSFIYNRALSGLRKVVEEMNEAALLSVTNANELYAELPNGLSKSNQGRIAQSVLLDDHLLDVDLSRRGILALRYEIPKAMREYWEQNFDSSSLSLELLSTLLEHRGGKVLFSGISEDCLEIEMALPDPETKVSSQHEEAEQVLERREAPFKRVSNSTEAFKIIALRREATMPDDIKRSYMVECCAAAILSKSAAKNFVRLLEDADSIMAAIPDFNSIECLASGTAEAITEKFNQGNFELCFRTDDGQLAQYQSVEPALELLQQPFDWQSDEGEHSFENRMNRILDQRSSLSIPRECVGDPIILEALQTITQKAPVFSLGLCHEQETSFETDEELLTFTQQLVREVERVMLEVYEQHAEDVRSVRLMPVVAMRIAHIGSYDDIYSLVIEDKSGNSLAVGRYSREKGQIEYKVLDSQLQSELYERLAQSAQKVLQEDGKLSFRSLDRELEKAQVLLYEELLMRIVESSADASGDQVVSPDVIKECIGWMIERPDVTLKKDGTRILVEELEAEDKAADSGLNYGIITQLDGSDPEEVRTFMAAKKLVEDGHPTFKPSQRFFDENR